MSINSMMKLLIEDANTVLSEVDEYCAEYARDIQVHAYEPDDPECINMFNNYDILQKVVNLLEGLKVDE